MAKKTRKRASKETIIPASSSSFEPVPIPQRYLEPGGKSAVMPKYIALGYSVPEGNWLVSHGNSMEETLEDLLQFNRTHEEMPRETMRLYKIR